MPKKPVPGPPPTERNLVKVNVSSNVPISDQVARRLARALVKLVVRDAVDYNPPTSQGVLEKNNEKSS